MLSRRAALSRGLFLLLLPAVRPALALTSEKRLLTITYPGGPAIQFDPAYYRDHHLALFMDIYGQSIERFELRTVQESQTFSALINIWIADFELFKARSTAAAYKRMGDDKKNFTNTSSMVEVDEMTYEAGERRSSMANDVHCLSLLYPAGKAGHWQDDKRCGAYIEGMMNTKLIRRIELRQGIQLLDDGGPTYQGGVNLYLRNSTDSSVAEEAASNLSSKLCDTQPIQLHTTVFGTNHA